MLDRVVVILLALAVLAQRAAAAPRQIRCIVFWILRQAETVATEFVASPACSAAHGNSARMIARHGSNPADELSLALSLTRLARVVATLVAQLRRLAFLHRGRPSGGKEIGHGPQDGVPGAFGMTLPQVARPDTS